MGDQKDAALMIDGLLKAKVSPADRRYDADWFHAALTRREIAACIRPDRDLSIGM